MRYGLHGHRASPKRETHTTRAPETQRGKPAASAEGVHAQDGDTVVLECPDPESPRFHVRLLNRATERSATAPAAPRKRPVLAPPHHASSAAQAARVRPRLCGLSGDGVEHRALLAGPWAPGEPATCTAE